MTPNLRLIAGREFGGPVPNASARRQMLRSAMLHWPRPTPSRQLQTIPDILGILTNASLMERRSMQFATRLVHSLSYIIISRWRVGSTGYRLAPIGQGNFVKPTRSCFLALSVFVLSSQIVLASDPPGDAGSNAQNPPASNPHPFADRLSGVFDKFKNALQGQAQQTPQPALPPGTVNLFDTRLDNLLARNPSTSNVMPEWPRIALSDVELPAVALKPVGIGRTLMFDPGDCITFKATIWTDEQTSEVLDKVAVCAADMKTARGARLKSSAASDLDEVDMRFPIPGETTGALRTSGPKPPNFAVERRMTDTRRRYTSGGVLTCIGMLERAVGFDPSTDLRRFWIVNFTNVP